VLATSFGCRDGSGLFSCREQVDSRLGENQPRRRSISNLFCRGDAATAINRQMEGPGHECGERRPATTPSYRYPALPLSETPGTVQDPRVANLSCLSGTDDRELMQRMGVSLTSSAQENETEMVARMVSSVVDVAGEEVGRNLLSGLSVNFVPHLRLRRNPAGLCLPGHYRLDNSPHLNLARRCHPDAVDREGNRINQTQDSSDEHLTALLYHEVGHHVGSRSNGRGSLRSAYQQQVRTRCQISHYCSSSHSEEFAEVFAAFMYATDRLKAQCPEAYSFMKNSVFRLPQGEERSCDLRPGATRPEDFMGP
jgi:hypothetical protein